MYFSKLYFFSLFALFYQTGSYSQDKNVKYIDDYHEYMVNQRVTDDYHVNEYKLNAENNDFPDALKYTRTERYFYSYKGGAAPSLRTILVKIENGGLKYNQEFLFDIDGNLMLFFEGQNDTEKYAFRTFNLYFDKKNLVYCKEGEKNLDKTLLKKEHFEKARIVLEEASYYLRKFTDYQLPEINRIK